MKKFSEDFTLKVDGVKGVCPAGEAWAEEQIRQKKIPVFACEGPCVRGDIARRVANIVGKGQLYARACFPEVAFVPHSGMAHWVKEAESVVMVDGCFLKCIGRMLKNQVDHEKIIQIDALQYYHKYTDVFHMDDVPEAERIDIAQQVAEQILPIISEVSRSETWENPLTP